MSDDPYEKIVSWNDVYNQTVGLSEEAAEQEEGEWGEEGFVCFRLSTVHASPFFATPW